jgi:hypothetical protein
MTGRPSLYTPEIAETICCELAAGRSLRSICEDEDMPNARTVHRWLATHEEFRQHYARAKEECADYYSEEIVEIVDGADDPQRARVRMDARKWYASKLAPKKYGDKVVSEVTGKDGGPIQTESLTEIEVARRLAFALTRGGVLQETS